MIRYCISEISRDEEVKRAGAAVRLTINADFMDSYVCAREE